MDINELVGKKLEDVPGFIVFEVVMKPIKRIIEHHSGVTWYLFSYEKELFYCFVRIEDNEVVKVCDFIHFILALAEFLPDDYKRQE